MGALSQPRTPLLCSFESIPLTSCFTVFINQLSYPNLLADSPMLHVGSLVFEAGLDDFVLLWISVSFISLHYPRKHTPIRVKVP